MALTKIYLIRSGDFVKIGKADNPIVRWQGLQTASPTPLELLGWIEADAAHERRLHKRFAPHRVRGEWFRWSADFEDIAATITKPSADTLSCGPKPTPKGICMNAGQCRTARAWLNMNAQELAGLAGVTRHTINRFEAGKTSPTAATARVLRNALEKAGAEFPDEHTVRFQPPKQELA